MTGTNSRVQATGRIIVATLLAASFASAQEVGMTREQLVSLLGEPSGEVTGGAITTLFYQGGGIEMEGGIVSFVPENFEKTAEQRRAIRAFEDRQRAKGLVMHQGFWMKPEEAEVRKEEQARKEKEAALIEEFKRKKAAAAAARPRTVKPSGVVLKKRTIEEPRKKEKSLSSVNQGFGSSRYEKLSSFDQTKGYDKSNKRRKGPPKKRPVATTTTEY